MSLVIYERNFTEWQHTFLPVNFLLEVIHASSIELAQQVVAYKTGGHCVERHTFHRVRATKSTSTTYSHPETLVVMCEVRVASLLKDVREGEVCVKIVERDEALEWLRVQSCFTFKVNHGPGVIGNRYWSHQDQKWRRRMACSPGHSETKP